MDVVGFSAGGDALVMGDCLWTDTPPGPEAVESLLRRATHALPRKDEDGDPTPVYFVAFSRAPWSADARDKAAQLLDAAALKNKKRWQPLGIRLLDLATVDRDLAQWSV